jgi:hypothetical protein
LGFSKAAPEPRPLGFFLSLTIYSWPGMQSGPTKCGRAHSCRSICRISGSSSSLRLGADLWRSARTLLVSVAVVFAEILLVDFAVAQYQELRVRERGSRLAKLAELALASLEGEVTWVSDLGDGRYEVVVSLSNVRGEQPIYVMSPDMRAYVQVGKIWHKCP